MRVLLSRERRNGESGATALLIACLTVVFAGVLAFVADFGMAYTNLRVLQTGADAGAIAAARQIAWNSAPSDNCGTLASYWTTDDRARSIAQSYFEMNNPSGDAAIAPGAAGFDLTCTDNSPTGKLVVEVTTKQNSPTFFGKLFGATRLPVQQTAKAVVGPAGEIVGIRPFAICAFDAEQIEMASPNPYNVLVTNHHDDNNCGDASGNFGWIDVDGAANATGDVGDWLTYGFPAPVATSSSTCTAESPDCLESTPGVRTALSDAMETVLGKEIVFPVFDAATGSGSTVQYHITGFLSAQLCGWRLSGTTTDRDAEFASQVATPCYSSAALPDPGSKKYIQILFRKIIPIGQINQSACGGVGDPDCDFGVRLAKLTE